ncbi:MAG TPA: enoyl-CoA hydratase/isomerase family protein [Bacillota bacterium]|nr:enoyl-CoA hydratase/isomerase family protein [Bacillota bacterium]
MFQVTKKEQFVHIQFNYLKGNLIDLQFVQHFFDTLNNLDDSTRIVVIEGAPHFCVGMNLDTLHDMKVSEVETLFSIYEQLLHKIENLPFITIAKMTGFAMGAGAELALACDFRWMEQKAKIGFPGVNVGFAYNTKRLPNLIPRYIAKRLVLTGSTLTSTEALHYGIADKVVSKNQMEEELHSFALSFMDKSPTAIQYAKAAFCEMDPSRAMALSIQTKHYQEGAAAFLEKRKPCWK